MIKIENVEVVGWQHAIRGMRNSWNSHDKSDTDYTSYFTAFCDSDELEIGENDLALMKKLSKAGESHRKFMRMIVVYADITAPMYWWKQADQYKVGTVRNSCSTMHTIANKEFTIDDFSYEHLIENPDFSTENEISIADSEKMHSPKDILTEWIIPSLNVCRAAYLKTKDKKYWWQIIQLLPSSYNQKSTFMFNYEVLANIYRQRKNHKLQEWKDLRAWIETLPYSELITGKDEG